MSFYMVVTSLMGDKPSLADSELELLTKKDIQCEKCKLSFIGGKMRTSGWKTASQRALRWWGKVNIYDISEGEFNAVKHLFYKRFSASHQELTSS